MGSFISRMSVWRIATGAGQVLARRKKVEAERASAPARLDEVYRTACHLQAEAVLEASVRLMRQGLLEG